VANETAVLIESTGPGVLSVRSDLTFATVTAVLRHSRPLLRTNSERLVIDLADVVRADSAGLALLMEWLRMAGASGAEILYRHVPEQLLAIARASDLERLIPLEG
jgi:phospholipid transport system transporter-binding protein